MSLSLTGSIIFHNEISFYGAANKLKWTNIVTKRVKPTVKLQIDSGYEILVLSKKEPENKDLINSTKMARKMII